MFQNNFLHETVATKRIQNELRHKNDTIKIHLHQKIKKLYLSMYEKKHKMVSF